MDIEQQTIYQVHCACGEKVVSTGPDDLDMWLACGPECHPRNPIVKTKIIFTAEVPQPVESVRMNVAKGEASSE